MRASDEPGAAGSLRAAVISVVPEGAEEDVAGTIVAGALTMAHHQVVARERVGHSTADLQARLHSLLDTGVDVMVVTGGAGVTARDVAPDAVTPLLTRAIPGFGELYRLLAFQQVGAVAMFSRALAGMVDRTVVFVVPDARRAVQLAMEQLILPELSNAVALARTEAGLGHGEGWQAAVTAVEGRLHRDQREPLPEALMNLDAVRDVLHEAGEQAALEVGSWRYSVWGFPDLRRPSSRVLAISAGGTLAEVVALHHHPAQVGTCVRGDGGWVVSRDRPVAAVAATRTGEVPPSRGSLFAVGRGVVYIERDRRVVRWDGRHLVDLGPPGRALGTLVREWTA